MKAIYTSVFSLLFIGAISAQTEEHPDTTQIDFGTKKVLIVRDTIDASPDEEEQAEIEAGHGSLRLEAGGKRQEFSAVLEM